MVAMGAIASAAWVLAPPASAGAQDAGGTLQFTEVFAGRAPDPTGTIVAKGVINGVGHVIGTSGDADIWSFPRLGTIMFTRQVVSSTDDFDPRTCVERFSGVETFRLDRGTGALSGLVVEGTFTDHGVFIADREDGGCAQDSGSLAVVATGQGSTG
jgi:hypothetical protein